MVVGVLVEHELELTAVVAPRGEQPVLRERRRLVLAAAERLRSPGDLLPQRGRRVQQEEVDVASGGERFEDVDVAAREAGQPEHAEARRQVGQIRLFAQAGTCAREALGRIGLADAGAQTAVELGLPRGVGRDAGVVARDPGADHLRAVERVAVEQAGEVTDGRKAAAGMAAEVRGQALEPELAERLVDDLEQRPDRRAPAARDPPRGPRPRRRPR